MLGREFRITTTQDYNNIYRDGEKFPGKYLILYVAKNQLGHNRYGIVTSHKVGKAVVRNRIKRRLRALVRKMDPAIKPGHDMVLVVRHHAGAADYQQLEKDLSMVIRKAKL
ncbi:MAG TPA: ribonuclease P protein component [Syntrophomonadaceae bacterium]|nr:ribonuclease P protein component [Syntrophomonadaceae bacterium]HPU48692.1 ribonuclease P protein component [Syntrophomonadaceae bacterium]